MKGYILTIEQEKQLQGQYYSEYQFFNCVQDINGVWFLFLSEEDKVEIELTEWSWILQLTEGEYTPPIAPPFPSKK
tara:strand:- start:478 stop:705 length:228 start_codon:yes stop_codon:yes gene_type:complete